MAAAACPAYGDLLAALEGEFRAVDRAGLDSALDELALPLFGLEQVSVEERAMAIGRAAWAAMPDEAEAPEAWLLGTALESGRAAGPVRAGFATELGHRAGVPAHPARLRGCWAIHVRGEAVGVAVDVGPDASMAGASGPRGCLCAHQLAFVIATSLVDAWQSAGDSTRARRARVLSLALLRGGAP
jgi:hypothetical protein